MKSHIAEYVSPGHPDRLADAIVESIVDLAVRREDEKASDGIRRSVPMRQFDGKMTTERLRRWRSVP